jgi:hypothetical protein
MKCPYCAEEIADAALIYKHCRRDFTFFQPLLKPLWEKIRGLEDDIAALRCTLESGLQSPNVVKNGQTILQSTIIVISSLISISLLILIFQYRLSDLFDLDVSDGLAFALLVFGGFITGTYFDYYRIVLFFLISTVIASICFFILVYGDMPSSLWFMRPYPASALILFLTMVCLSFVLLGNWLKGLTFPQRQAECPLARTIAQLFGSKNHGDIDRRVKKWNTIITTFAPVLTLLGTIFSASLSYLAKK